MILKQARKNKGYQAAGGSALYDADLDKLVMAVPGDQDYNTAGTQTFIPTIVATPFQYATDTSYDYTDGQSITAEIFMFMRAAPSSDSNIAARGGSTGNVSNWILGINSSRQLWGYIGGGGWGLVTSVVSTTQAPLNQWCHIALVIAGYTLKIFLDGVMVATATSGGGAQVDVQPLYINGGADGRPSINADFGGWRFTRSEVYTSNFTPPSVELTTLANTVTRWTGGVSVYPASVSVTSINRQLGKFYTLDGTATVSTAQAKFGTKSLYPGSSGGISIPYSPAFDPTSFYIEAWLYRTGTPTGTCCIFSRGGNPGNQPTYALYMETNGTLTALTGASSYYPDASFNIATPIPLNTWTHVRLTLNGTTLRVFVNGVLAGNASGTGIENDQQPFYIGGAPSIGLASFPGYIDAFLFSKDTYTSTASFTVPTSPPANLSKALLRFNFEGDDVMPDGIGPVIVGNPHSVPVDITGYNGYSSSLIFDGSSLVQFPNSSQFNLAGLDWTFMCKAKWDGTSNQGIFGRRNSSTSSGLGLYINTSGILRLALQHGSGFVEIPSVTVLPANTWRHIAITCKSGTIRMFIDGVLDVTYVLPSNMVDQPQPFTIGSVSSYGEYPFKGYMQDFLFWLGVAKHITNFTPSTLTYRSRLRGAPGVQTSLR